MSGLPTRDSGPQHVVKLVNADEGDPPEHRAVVYVRCNNVISSNIAIVLGPSSGSKSQTNHCCRSRIASSRRFQNVSIRLHLKHAWAHHPRQLVQHSGISQSRAAQSTINSSRRLSRKSHTRLGTTPWRIFPSIVKISVKRTIRSEQG